MLPQNEEERCSLLAEARAEYGHLPSQKLTDLTYLAYQRLIEVKDTEDQPNRLAHCLRTYTLLSLLTGLDLESQNLK